MRALKTTLLVNAISSGATGLLLALAPGLFAGLFGVSNTMPFTEVGIFLIAFAASVLYVGTRKNINVKSVRLITTLDLLWVMASIVAVFLLTDIVSTTGIVIIIAVAGWVGLMAFLQFKGMYAGRGSHS